MCILLCAISALAVWLKKQESKKYFVLSHKELTVSPQSQLISGPQSHTESGKWSEGNISQREGALKQK